MSSRAVIRVVFLGIVLAALASCGPGEEEGPSRALDELIASERAFAQRSLDAGMRQAFLDFLADDSVLFFPVAVPGRQFMESRPEPAGQLEWAPSFADISAAGDLGYTTGPYKFSTRGPDGELGPPFGHGHFTSVWKRQDDGTWKVVLDIGIDHSRNPGPFPQDVTTSDPTAAAAREGDEAAEREALMELDRSMSDPKNFATALLENADDTLRLHQFNFVPFVGKTAAAEALSESDVRVVWRPAASRVARSLDLGYTYGIGELITEGLPPGAPTKLSYARIWKRRADGPWKVVMEVALPAPDPPGAG
jgi:ketosteroid isomerase-like protein